MRAVIVAAGAPGSKHGACDDACAPQAMLDGTDPVLVVTPCDQTITDLAAFTMALERAADHAAEGALVILGIRPQRPATGYGYIRAGTLENGAAPVLGFVEKPDAATAEANLAEGSCFWNAGMVVCRSSVWLDALRCARPDILEATRAAFVSRREDDLFVRPDSSAFMNVPAESIDRAVLEQTPGGGLDIRMAPLDAGWSDVGSWEAVWQLTSKDSQGNVAVGDVFLQNTCDSLVHASQRLVGVVGLRNLVVVETPDAVLVSDR